jgi:hypothetical protein
MIHTEPCLRRNGQIASACAAVLCVLTGTVSDILSVLPVFYEKKHLQAFGSLLKLRLCFSGWAGFRNSPGLVPLGSYKENSQRK